VREQGEGAWSLNQHLSFGNHRNGSLVLGEIELGSGRLCVKDDVWKWGRLARAFITGVVIYLFCETPSGKKRAVCLSLR
jgi:hypothetical protein